MVSPVEVGRGFWLGLVRIWFACLLTVLRSVCLLGLLLCACYRLSLPLLGLVIFWLKAPCFGSLFVPAEGTALPLGLGGLNNLFLLVGLGLFILSRNSVSNPFATTVDSGLSWLSLGFSPFAYVYAVACRHCFLMVEASVSRCRLFGFTLTQALYASLTLVGANGTFVASIVSSTFLARLCQLLKASLCRCFLVLWLFCFVLTFACFRVGTHQLLFLPGGIRLPCMTFGGVRRIPSVVLSCWFRFFVGVVSVLVFVWCGFPLSLLFGCLPMLEQRACVIAIGRTDHEKQRYGFVDSASSSRDGSMLIPASPASPRFQVGIVRLSCV